VTISGLAEVPAVGLPPRPNSRPDTDSLPQSRSCFQQPPIVAFKLQYSSSSRLVGSASALRLSLSLVLRSAQDFVAASSVRVV